MATRTAGPWDVLTTKNITESHHIVCAEGGYLATVFRRADAQAMAATPALIAALQRLETAAERRDSHMGDPIRLLDAKAELAAAAKHAREVLASAEGRS